MAVQAINDEATTPANTATGIAVLTNDEKNGVAPVAPSDLVGVPVLLTPPSNGVAVWDADTETFVYTPNEGYCGPDAFVYAIEEATLAGTAQDGLLVLTGVPAGATVVWGDGSPDEVSSGATMNHTYSGGPHTFGVTGGTPGAPAPLVIAGSGLRTVTEWSIVAVWGCVRIVFSTGPNTSPNLVAVPDYLPSSVVGLTYMFATATAFNQDISGWDTSNVLDMGFVFYGATAFNQDIGGWDTSSAVNMPFMFYGAAAFNQDLSGWCVSAIPSEPSSFATGAAAWVLPKPVWGTCP